MKNIAIVVPTCRKDCWENFKKNWDSLFRKHDVYFVTVFDGDEPYVEWEGIKKNVREIMGEKYEDLIYNHNDGVRNLGFAFVDKNILFSEV